MIPAILIAAAGPPLLASAECWFFRLLGHRRGRGALLAWWASGALGGMFGLGAARAWVPAAICLLNAAVAGLLWLRQRGGAGA